MARNWKQLPRSRFDNVLRKLPKAAADGIHSALRENGTEAVRIIQGDAPVEDGALQKSVGWSFGDPPPYVMGRGDYKHSNIPVKLRISIYAGGLRAPHAHLVHNGTAMRATKTGAKRGVMPAQPFFWPNIRSLRRRMKGRITRRGNKAIRAFVKR